MSKKIFVKCAYCNREFERYRYKNRKLYFCNRLCSAKYRIGKPSKRTIFKKKEGLMTSCAYCNVPLYRAKNRLQYKFHFCSTKCQGKWNTLYLWGEKAQNWKGGTYSTIAKTLCNSRYRRIRKSVLLLDKYICQLCGRIDISKNLQIHHIIEKGKNSSLIFDITNMITLCKVCHWKIRSKEEDYIGYFNDIVEKRANSEKPLLNSEATPNQTPKIGEVRRDHIPSPKGMIWSKPYGNIGELVV